MGDPTGWFDRLYAAGAAGRVPLPWGRREPHPLLTEWAQRHHLAGQGKRAIVPGCALGADAEYLAGLGFATTAFAVGGLTLAPAEIATMPGKPAERRWRPGFHRRR